MTDEKKTDWQKVALDILAAFNARVVADDVGVTTETLYALRRGSIGEPKHSVGQALLRHHRRAVAILDRKKDKEQDNAA